MKPEKPNKTYNPRGKGMTQQPIYMSEEMAADLKKAAKRDGLSLNQFCRAILEDYMKRCAVVKQTTFVEFPPESEPPHPVRVNSPASSPVRDSTPQTESRSVTALESDKAVSQHIASVKESVQKKGTSGSR